MFSSVMKAAVLSAFCGLLYLVIWTDAAQSGTLFKVESLAYDINYGHVIATTKAKSAIHCSSKCESWSCCRSGVFNVSTATCYLNSKTKSSGGMVKGEYGKKLKYIEKQAVSRKCESKAECIEKNLVHCEDTGDVSCVDCREGECSCLHYKYRFNINDNTCRYGCQKYDDTFEHYSSYTLDWNKKSKLSNASLEECKEACLCETSFTCIWFSYAAESALCTYTDGYYNEQNITSVDAVLYRRLCADQ